MLQVSSDSSKFFRMFSNLAPNLTDTDTPIPQQIAIPEDKAPSNKKPTMIKSGDNQQAKVTSRRRNNMLETIQQFQIERKQKAI